MGAEFILLIIAIGLMTVLLLKIIYLYLFDIKAYKRTVNIWFPEIIKGTQNAEILIISYSDDREIQFCKIDGKFYQLPMMDLCSSSDQEELERIDKYIKMWKGDYPNAHLKQKNN